jgi:hypothetical protein
MSNYVQLNEESTLEFQSFEQQPNSQYQPDFKPVEPAQPTSYSFWTIDYYKQYFDVDSVQVGQRILATIIPTHDFLGLLSPPDLYGPFWIPTTVVFMLFASSTVTQSLVAIFQEKKYTYDLTLLSWAISTVYSFVLIIPAIIWAIVSYYKLPIKLLEIVNLYGYGLVIWAPVSILCIIPNEIVKWIIVMTAFASSTLFKIRNLQPVLQHPRAMFLVLTLVTLSQAALTIMFKFVFFSMVCLSPSCKSPIVPSS